ncbi:unnamed protein product, partial [Rotaria sp. Silwood2]
MQSLGNDGIVEKYSLGVTSTPDFRQL